METIVENILSPKQKEAIDRQPEIISKFYIKRSKLYAKIFDEDNDIVLAQLDNAFKPGPRDKIFCKFIGKQIKVSAK